MTKLNPTTLPVIRRFRLPNGDVITSLRESTLQAAILAANAELRRLRDENDNA